MVARALTEGELVALAQSGDGDAYASLVRGSHGVQPASPDEQPLLISRHAADLPPEIEPTAVFDIVLAHLQRK